jgi:hypothetical protein
MSITVWTLHRKGSVGKLRPCNEKEDADTFMQKDSKLKYLTAVMFWIFFYDEDLCLKILS